MHNIHIVGPRELEAAERAGLPVVWTVSRAGSDWQRELSPFFLGPVPLYGGRQARCMEGAWQFAKLYAQHADAAGEPTDAYWRWARDGWSRPAIRYPMGKGARPLCLLWDGARLDYIDARKRVYWPLYRDAVRQTAGFRTLKEMHARGALALFDFDGYDHEARGMGLREVIAYPKRPMGHAFVLKAMLLHGEDIDADRVPAEAQRVRAPVPQASLF